MATSSTRSWGPEKLASPLQVGQGRKQLCTSRSADSAFDHGAAKNREPPALALWAVWAVRIRPPCFVILIASASQAWVLAIGHGFLGCGHRFVGHHGDRAGAGQAPHGIDAGRMHGLLHHRNAAGVQRRDRPARRGFVPGLADVDTHRVRLGQGVADGRGALHVGTRMPVPIFTGSSLSPVTSSSVWICTITRVWPAIVVIASRCARCRRRSTMVLVMRSIFTPAPRPAWAAAGVAAAGRTTCGTCPRCPCRPQNLPGGSSPSS